MVDEGAQSVPEHPPVRLGVVRMPHAQMAIRVSVLRLRGAVDLDGDEGGGLGSEPDRRCSILEVAKDDRDGVLDAAAGEMPPERESTCSSVELEPSPFGVVAEPRSVVALLHPPNDRVVLTWLAAAAVIPLAV